MTERKNTILSLINTALAIVGAVATVFSCLIAFIVLVNPTGAQKFIIELYNPVTPTPQVIVITQPIPTLPPLPTYTFIPINTPAPTNTLLPTNAPLPSATTKAYYLQGEGVSIKDGVYISLAKDFISSIHCANPTPGFVLRLYVENKTDEQFNLRFDASSFHAVDDLGNEYRLVQSGIRNCDNSLGIKEEIIGSYDTNFITLSFSGQIPLNATYILITADWISGVSQIVFRKNIY